MPAFLENPALRSRVAQVSVETYQRIYERGVELGNVEMLHGVLFQKKTKSPLYCWALGSLRAHLEQYLPADHYVRQGHVLTCGDSEPEPALAAVRGDPENYSAAHPTTASLIVEIPIVSEATARLKLGIYAEAGVPECWLWFVERKIVERCTQPSNSGYQNVERRTAPATLVSTVFPDVVMFPPELLRDK